MLVFTYTKNQCRISSQNRGTKSPEATLQSVEVCAQQQQQQKQKQQQQKQQKKQQQQQQCWVTAVNPDV